MYKHKTKKKKNFFYVYLIIYFLFDILFNNFFSFTNFFFVFFFEMKKSGKNLQTNDHHVGLLCPSFKRREFFSCFTFVNSSLISRNIKQHDIVHVGSGKLQNLHTAICQQNFYFLQISSILVEFISFFISIFQCKFSNKDSFFYFADSKC